MKTVKILSFGVAALMMLSSCGSKKHGVIDIGNPELPHQTVTQNVSQINISSFQKTLDTNTEAKCVVSKIHATVNLNGKSVSTNGTLRMKKDEVIQISLMDPLLGIMELGQLEFTQDRVLVIIRIKKEYVEVPYSDISMLKTVNVNFNSLQSLFWNQIFEPGYFKPDPMSFAYREHGNDVDICFTDKILKYVFSTTAVNGVLTNTEIEDNTGDYKLNFKYDNFFDYEGGKFPRNMKLDLKAEKSDASLELELLSPRNEGGWPTRTSAPSSYTKVSADKVFHSLVN